MASLKVTWLGQSGYAVRNLGDDALLLVDPYLSNYAEEELGKRRVAASVLDVSKARVTALVATHWHSDHLDPITCRAIASTSPECVFIGPSSNESRLLGWGVEPERIVSIGRGDAASAGPFVVHGEFARHEVPGWLCEDALSVVIDAGGVRVFHSGDTEYDSRTVAARRLGPLDLGLFVINGTGGNMDAEEAALLAHKLDPRLAIPCHYGMWDDDGYGPGATLDPEIFRSACDRLGGPRTTVLALGDSIEV